ncbi:MAG: hypothetical protein ACRDIY_15590 [Chloroflexota bacterium]
MITTPFHRVGLAAIGLALVGVIGLLIWRPYADSARRPSPSPRPSRPATLSVSPGLAQQDGRVSFRAGGFAPGESVIFRVGTGATGSADLDLTSAQADVGGTVTTGPITLPDEVYSGTHPLVAVGQRSNRRATATLDVHAKAPWINLSTNGIKPLENFGLIVGGFQPGETIQVSLEPAPRGPNGASQDPTKLSKPTALVSLRADPVGNTTWSETRFPLLRPGAYTLVARGGSSSKRLTANVVVTAFTPNVQLSPWAGPPGTRIQLNVRGFAPHETVQIFLGQDTTATLTTTTDQYGNFWGVGPLRVPYSVNDGSLAVRLVGTASGAEVAAAFRVLAPKPWLDLTAWSGPPGAPVGFSGGGWAADERVAIHLGSASGPVVDGARADDGGWLSAGGATGIPGDAQNAVTFVAVGEQSRATASATFKVVNPFESLPPSLQPQNVPAPPPLPTQNPPP